jgi:hypothetical protein
VCITLGRYAVLCQAPLLQGTGPSNPAVEVLWNLLVALQASPFINDRYLQAAAIIPMVAHVNFPCIVRTVQVSMHEYFHGFGANIAAGLTGVDLPDFRTLVVELKRGTFQFSSHWVPIPEEYLAQPRIHVSTSSVPSAASISGSSSQASTRTGVPSLTADTSRTPSSAPTTPRRTPSSAVLSCTRATHSHCSMSTRKRRGTGILRGLMAAKRLLPDLRASCDTTFDGRERQYQRPHLLGMRRGLMQRCGGAPTSPPTLTGRSSSKK